MINFGVCDDMQRKISTRTLKKQHDMDLSEQSNKHMFVAVSADTAENTVFTQSTRASKFPLTCTNLLSEKRSLQRCLRIGMHLEVK